MGWIWILALNVLWVVACYNLAKNKGYSTGWAIFWGLIGGLIALIVYAVLPGRRMMGICPSCGRGIDNTFVACPYCGHQRTAV